MTAPQPNNPLHGITLEKILTALHAHYGWEELGRQIDIVQRGARVWVGLVHGLLRGDSPAAGRRLSTGRHELGAGP